MIKDITVGQFYPTDSQLHKLDPRTKLFATFLFVVSLFVFSSFRGYIVVSIFLGLCIYMSKVPLSFILRGLKPIFFLLIFTALINMFMTPGEVLIKYGIITITKNGFRNAIFMSIRLIYMIVGSSLLTLTTTPNSLTQGLEKSLKIFRRVGVPVHELAMMMSIAMSFIPILVEETDKITKAQMSRCADFESKNIVKRVKSYIPVLVPLFISAFRRANDLAMAMEARCYRGGDNRTTMKPLKYKLPDYLAYIICIIYFAAIIAVALIFKKPLFFKI